MASETIHNLFCICSSLDNSFTFIHNYSLTRQQFLWALSPCYPLTLRQALPRRLDTRNGKKREEGLAVAIKKRSSPDLEISKLKLSWTYKLSFSCPQGALLINLQLISKLFILLNISKPSLLMVLLKYAIIWLISLLRFFKLAQVLELKLRLFV